MENKVKLTIEGMHCEACVRRVTTALSGVEGVRVDSVAVGSASVAIEDASVQAEELAAAVDRIGFTARIDR